MVLPSTERCFEMTTKTDYAFDQADRDEMRLHEELLAKYILTNDQEKADIMRRRLASFYRDLVMAQ
jgi:hypothetical protein